MNGPAVNVCTTTVTRDLCIGCGACAGVCPRLNLHMVWNSRGEYNPADSGNCADQCGLCMDVCPFSDSVPGIDDLARELYSHLPGIDLSREAGFFMHGYVGHAAGGYRAAGASGGAASWFLSTLLDRQMVDRVICVEPSDDPSCFFRFASFTESADVRRCAKSAYYPVQMSEVVRDVLANDARYAVIGLPCFMRALRLAEQRIPRLHERITIHAGLVCGQLKSRYFAEYLIRLAGMRPDATRGISFREKDSQKPATELIFEARDSQNCSRLAWSEGYGHAWTTGQFKINACNFCDDVFAELADVVFMDAWLPEYTDNGAGTSIVLCRTQQVDEMMQRGIRAGELSMEPLDIRRVVASQYDPLYDKRRSLAWRLWIAEHAGRPRPATRVAPVKPDPLRARLLKAREIVRRASGEAMALQRDTSPEGLEIYNGMLATPLSRLRRARMLVDTVSRLISAPARLRGMLRRTVKE